MEKIDFDFVRRLEEVLKEKFKGNKTQFATSAGIKSPSAQAWFEGKTNPKVNNLVRLSNVTGINLLWLATGEGEKYKNLQENLDKSNTVSNLRRLEQIENQLKITDTQGNLVNINDFVFIPFYDVNASAGHGTWTDNEPQKTTLAFRRDWLATFVTRYFEQLSVVSVQGDSMSGVLEDGDTILINHTQTEPRDGLYALRIGNDVFVKRIQRFPDHLLIKSANPEYTSFTLDTTQDSDESIAIIGKVVWLGRKI